MNLNYNRPTGHIKLDGALIGRVEVGLSCCYIPFKFVAEIIEAPNLKDLLDKIRETVGG